MGNKRELTEKERKENLDKLLDQNLEHILEGMFWVETAGVDPKHKQEVIKAQLQNLKTIKRLIHYKPIKEKSPFWETVKSWIKKINPILWFTLLKEYFK